MTKEYEHEYQRCYDEDLLSIEIEITQEMIAEGREKQYWASSEAITLSEALKTQFPYADLFVLDSGVYVPEDNWRTLIFHIAENLKGWIKDYNKRTRIYKNNRPTFPWKEIDSIKLVFIPYSPIEEDHIYTLGIKDKDFYFRPDETEFEE